MAWTWVGFDLPTRVAAVVALLFILPTFSLAQNKEVEAGILLDAMRSWENGNATLGATWFGNDPCVFTGVQCNDNYFVINLNLGTRLLKGPLPKLQGLAHLEKLDLSFNLFTGAIPAEWGSFTNLTSLMLKNNKLSGHLPAELGAGLQKLIHFDIDENENITGPIPASFGKMKNLEILHLSNLALTGEIPPELGELTKLKELTIWGSRLSGGMPYELGNLINLEYINLHTSQLRGNLPPELGNLTSLKRLRLHNNDFYGGIPEELGGMTNLTTEWSVRNNKLTGPVPESIVRMKNLQNLDLSQNQFTGPLPQALSNLTELAYLKIAFNYFTGAVPSIRPIATQSGWADKNCLDITPHIWAQKQREECKDFNFTLTDGCAQCPQPGTYYLTAKPCRCRIPLEIWLLYASRASPFDIQLFQQNVATQLGISTNEVVEIREFPSGDNGRYVQFWLIPEKGDYIREQAGAGGTGFTKTVQHYVNLFKTNQVVAGGSGYKLENYTKPMQWPSFPPTSTYSRPAENQSSPSNQSSIAKKDEVPKSHHLALGVGAGVGGIAILMAVMILVFFWRSKSSGPEDFTSVKDNPKSMSEQGTRSSDFGKKPRPTNRSTFSATGQSQSQAQSGSHLGTGSQFTSARLFSVQELSSACNDFAHANEVGVGGHARVYRGYIPPYGDVAIKRAKLRAIQGKEFQNELDVLSRVHHRNLVRFFGCCEEGDEQLLVYDFMTNGTLYAHLVGKGGRTLDWKLRLNIAIGTANGLNYLHNHADPPIIHRDVKPSNILLDENMNAKLGDFGISRMLEDPEDIVTFTRVAGTWGYLDPMYHDTRKLTDKSDVYSFGVVLLELVIGKESKESMGKRKPIQGDLPAWVEKEYLAGGLEAVIDPLFNGRYPYETMCRMLETGLWCTRPKWDDRPKIKEALTALEHAKAVAGKETVPEDSQTMVDVFGQHLFQNLGLRKPRGGRTPQAGGLLFSEDQLLGGVNGPPTSYSTSSVVMPPTYTKVEAR